MNNTNLYFLYSFTLKYELFVLCTCNVNGLTFQNSNTAATVKSAKKEEFYRTFIKIFRPKAVHFQFHVQTKKFSNVHDAFEAP